MPDCLILEILHEPADGIDIPAEDLRVPFGLIGEQPPAGILDFPGAGDGVVGPHRPVGVDVPWAGRGGIHHRLLEYGLGKKQVRVSEGYAWCRGFGRAHVRRAPSWG